jgi:hypothetical protein
MLHQSAVTKQLLLAAITTKKVVFWSTCVTHPASFVSKVMPDASTWNLHMNVAATRYWGKMATQTAGPETSTLLDVVRRNCLPLLPRLR